MATYLEMSDSSKSKHNERNENDVEEEEAGRYYVAPLRWLLSPMILADLESVECV